MTDGGLPPGIIINADDLGIHPRINAGILSAYQNGLLTSATMLMTTPYLEETVRDIVRPAALPVGIHLSLTEGKAIAPTEKIPDLVDEQGYFKLSAGRLMLRSLRSDSGRRLLAQIRLEIAAQLALARDWGVEPTHVDSHQHIHMRPAVFAVFEEEGRRFGIERMRFCREPLPRFAAYLGVGDALRRNNYAKWLLIRCLGGAIHPRLATADCFFGVLYSGVISKDVLRALLTPLDVNSSLEIGIHPGFPASRHELSENKVMSKTFISSPWRQDEHDVLCDREVIELVHERRLLPRSYDGTIKPGWSC